jgi:hypothetical protein
LYLLDHYKQIVECEFKARGEIVPEGFAITYNQESQLVKVFLNGESYGSLAEQQDVIISSWNDGKWEDK